MKTAHVEIRSQPPRGSWPHGPDRYIAVQIVPTGVEPLKCLNRSLAKKRGIEIIYCGEGYRNRTGPSSMFGRALAEAVEIADAINSAQ